MGDPDIEMAQGDSGGMGIGNVSILSECADLTESEQVCTSFLKFKKRLKTTQKVQWGCPALSCMHICTSIKFKRSDFYHILTFGSMKKKENCRSINMYL